jgi:DUF917 family protein/N-methylhydantoinase A/oxoprolinase/acetone carboxylase beta subunit
VCVYVRVSPLPPPSSLLPPPSSLVSLSVSSVVSWAKSPTTSDVTSGVVAALKKALGGTSSNNNAQSDVKSIDTKDVAYVAIGTTHFVNAVVTRSQALSKVACMRICGPATRSLDPLVDMPDDLRELVHGYTALLPGGFEVDSSEISAFNEDEVKSAIANAVELGLMDFAVTGVFSPSDPQQENRVKELILEAVPDARVSLSHELAQLGLLERENSVVLNASIRPLANKTMQAFRDSIAEIGLVCPMFICQNDGTLVSAEQAAAMPVLTFSSGPTNSLRGAGFLTNRTDAIVVDVGGTTTDVGALVKGFPRQASGAVKVGGVRTNFRMPDTYSVGLGGGSIVSLPVADNASSSPEAVTIGPKSVGYELTSKARTFGGSCLTATDIVVGQHGIDILAAGSTCADLNPQPLDVNKDFGGAENLAACVATIKRMVEDAVDMMKTSSEPVPAILVGGGSILVPDELEGVSEVLRPKNFAVANAIGAAISQVSGSVIGLVSFTSQAERIEKICKLEKEAIALAVRNGADEASCTIAQRNEISLQYMTGNNSRVNIKAVGNLAILTGSGGGSSAPVNATPGVTDSEATSSLDSKTSGIARLSEPSGVVQALPFDTKQQETSTVNADPETGLWELNETDLEYIACGAGLLGTGGGGSPYIGLLGARQALRQGHKICIRDPATLSDDDNVYCVAFMGAPVTLIEKLGSGTEIKDAFESIQEFEKAQATALMCLEIGGMNAMAPLTSAALTGVPVVDADGMSRAFPRLDMLSTVIYGSARFFPTGLADDKGNKLLLLQAASGAWLEKLNRAATTAMGSMAALALPPLSGTETRNSVVQYSYTRAWRIGKAVMEARAAKADPIAAFVEQVDGRLLFQGKVSDVHRPVESGYNKGFVLIQGLDSFKGSKLKVYLQNEYLLAEQMYQCNDSEQNECKVIACTPDLICIAETETGESVASDTISYGMRVSVLALAIVPLMRTEKALPSVGPQAFGFDKVEFQNNQD